MMAFNFGSVISKVNSQLPPRQGAANLRPIDKSLRIAFQERTLLRVITSPKSKLTEVCSKRTRQAIKISCKIGTRPCVLLGRKSLQKYIDDNDIQCWTSNLNDMCNVQGA